jgi:mRNA interferase MazF
MTHTQPDWLTDFTSLSAPHQAEVLALIQRFKHAGETAPERPLIFQGDVFLAEIAKSPEQGHQLRHPHVVIQADVLNHSRIATVVVCALSSQHKRLNEPGNFLLAAGEAHLPQASVVVVSQLSTVAKSELGEYIGRLSPERVAQILEGIRFQQRGYFRR